MGRGWCSSTHGEGALNNRRPLPCIERLAPLGLVLVICLVHWPLVTLQGSLFLDDMTELHMPIRSFFAAAWQAGEFPLWSPGIYLGFPLFAEGQAGPLYPPNWLLFGTLDAWKASGLSFVLHLCLGAVGAYAFLRRTTGVAASFLGGAAFGLGGHLAAHHYHLNLVQAGAWLPVILLLTERVLERARLTDLVLTALACAAMVLAGHPQTAVHTGIAVAVWAAARLAWREPDEAGRGRVLLAGGLLVVLAVGIACAQILPTLDLAGLSVRSEGTTRAERLRMHATPQMFSAMVVPSAFGTTEAGTHWLNPGGFARMGLDVFLGGPVVVLAILGMVRGAGRSAVLATLLAGGFLLVSLGPLTPLAGALFDLPVVRNLRCPDRFGLQAQAFLAFLAAAGLDAVQRRRVRWPAIAGVVGGVGLAVVFLILRTYRNGFKGNAVLLRDLNLDSIGAGAALVVAGVGLALIGRRGACLPPLPVSPQADGAIVPQEAGEAGGDCARLGIVLVLVAAILPLTDFSRRAVPTVDPSYWEEPWTVAAIRDASKADDGLGADAGRVAFRGVSSPYQRMGWAAGPSAYAQGTAALNYNLPLLYGLAAVDGILPLRRPDFLSVYEPIYRDPTASFGRLGARWLVTGRADAGPGLRPLGERNGLRLYEDATALPRAFAVHDVHPASPAAVRAAWEEGRDLLQTAWVEDAPPGVVVADPGPGALSTVRVTEAGNDSVVLAADLAAPGLVVLADAWAPGWEALVDGEPAPIVRVDGLFRGVYAPVGRHAISMEYRPASVRVGAWIGAASLVATIVLLAFGLWRGRARSGAPSCAGGESEAGVGVRALPASERAWRMAVVAVLTGVLAWSLIAGWPLWGKAFSVY